MERINHQLDELIENAGTFSINGETHRADEWSGVWAYGLKVPFGADTKTSLSAWFRVNNCARFSTIGRSDKLFVGDYVATITHPIVDSVDVHSTFVIHLFKNNSNN